MKTNNEIENQLINENELYIEYICAKTRGGQHANKTASNVRITHISTGLSVTVNGRNQHKNKQVALKLLKEKLLNRERRLKLETAYQKRQERLLNHVIKSTEYPTKYQRSKEKFDYEK